MKAKLRKLYNFLAVKFYDLTSKKVFMETAELYDTPNMTKYHHIVSALRYAAVEEYYQCNDFGRELYMRSNHYESDEAKQEDLNKFETLISSIENKGYDMNSAIYVDLDKNCINGTHRLAICVWFGIKKIPAKIIKRHIKSSTIQEMKDYYNLSDEDFNRLEKVYQRMREQIQ